MTLHSIPYYAPLLASHHVTGCSVSEDLTTEFPAVMTNNPRSSAIEEEHEEK